jgi:transcriptional regulator with XRE-family HTH domain
MRIQKGFGGLLRSYREKKGLSCKKSAGLVRRTKISSEYIKDVEKGKKYVILDAAAEIAEILNVALSDLWRGGDPLLGSTQEFAEKYDVSKIIKGIEAVCKKENVRRKSVQISGIDTMYLNKN